MIALLHVSYSRLAPPQDVFALAKRAATNQARVRRAVEQIHGAVPEACPRARLPPWPRRAVAVVPAQQEL